jgi:hypothetical protein
LYKNHNGKLKTEYFYKKTEKKSKKDLPVYSKNAMIYLIKLKEFM